MNRGSVSRRLENLYFCWFLVIVVVVRRDCCARVTRLVNVAAPVGGAVYSMATARSRSRRL